MAGSDPGTIWPGKWNQVNLRNERPIRTRSNSNLAPSSERFSRQRIWLQRQYLEYELEHAGELLNLWYGEERGYSRSVQAWVHAHTILNCVSSPHVSLYSGPVPFLISVFALELAGFLLSTCWRNKARMLKWASALSCNNNVWLTCESDHFLLILSRSFHFSFELCYDFMRSIALTWHFLSAHRPSQAEQCNSPDEVYLYVPFLASSGFTHRLYWTLAFD